MSIHIVTLLDGRNTMGLEIGIILFLAWLGATTLGIAIGSFVYNKFFDR